MIAPTLFFSAIFWYNITMKKKKIVSKKTAGKQTPVPESVKLKQQAADLVKQAESVISGAKKRFDALDPKTKKQLAATAAALALVAAMAARGKKKSNKK